MFRVLSIVVFLAVFGGIGTHYIFFRKKFVGVEKPSFIVRILKKAVFLLTLFFLEQKLRPLERIRKLVYLLGLLSLAVLAVTGFVPKVVLGKTISGYWLIVHATFAPVFAFCIAVLAVLWADCCRFDRADWPGLSGFLQLQTAASKRQERTRGLGQKICFWVIIALAIVVILSIVSSMFKLFGTHYQELLMELHRYGALALLPAAIIHTYLIILAKAGQVTG